MTGFLENKQNLVLLRDAIDLFAPAYSALRVFDNSTTGIGEVYYKMLLLTSTYADFAAEHPTTSLDGGLLTKATELINKRWRSCHGPIHSIAFLTNPRVAVDAAIAPNEPVQKFKQTGKTTLVG